MTVRLTFHCKDDYTEQDVLVSIVAKDNTLEAQIEAFAAFLFAVEFNEKSVRERLNIE